MMQHFNLQFYLLNKVLLVFISSLLVLKFGRALTGFVLTHTILTLVKPLSP